MLAAVTPGYAPPGVPVHTADELPQYCAVFVAVAAVIFVWDRIEHGLRARRRRSAPPAPPRRRDPTAGITIVRIWLLRPLVACGTARDAIARLLRHRDAWSEGSVIVERAADVPAARRAVASHTRAARLVPDGARRPDVTLAVAMTGAPIEAPWGCTRADVVSALEALAALEPPRQLDASVVWLTPDRGRRDLDRLRARLQQIAVPGRGSPRAPRA